VCAAEESSSTQTRTQRDDVSNHKEADYVYRRSHQVYHHARFTVSVHTRLWCVVDREWSHPSDMCRPCILRLSRASRGLPRTACTWANPPSRCIFVELSREILILRLHWGTQKLGSPSLSRRAGTRYHSHVWFRKINVICYVMMNCL